MSQAIPLVKYKRPSMQQKQNTVQQEPEPNKKPASSSFVSVYLQCLNDAIATVKKNIITVRIAFVSSNQI